MSTQVIAMLIIAITVVLFVINRLRPAFVSLMAVVALAAFGVLDFSKAFSGFANNTIMLIAGMMVIGLALIENGIADIIAKVIFEKFNKRPMALMIAILVSSAVLSAFLQNMAMLVVYFAIIDAYVVKSNGSLKRKTLYMIAMIGTLIGGSATLAGSSSPGIASNILEELGGGSFSFFEPVCVGLPVLIIVSICYPLFIHRLSEKQFYPNGETDDIPALIAAGVGKTEEKTIVKWKMWASAAVAVATTLSFIFLTSIKSGILALIGACILMASGCINSKKVIKDLDWSVLILLACTTGLANGFVATGLDVKMIDWLTSALGDNSSNAALWVIIFTFMSGIITNVISNSSACAIFSALAVSVAAAAGCSPRPLIMACMWGSCSGISLPISCATVSMSMAGGLNVKNYLTIGTLYSVIMWIVTAASIIVWYGLI